MHNGIAHLLSLWVLFFTSQHLDRLLSGFCREAMMGMVADVRYYPRMLTEAQVQQIAKHGADLLGVLRKLFPLAS